MTTYSTSELAVRVLRDLGLYGADETPTAEDQAWAEETCSAEILLLSAKKIPVWNGSEATIPQEYLTALSRRIGLAVAPAFGLTNVAQATLAMEAAERDLRIIGMIDPTGTTQQADHF